MDTIDYDAPRDFMDTMLNEANNNESEIGYHTIAMSIVGILVFKSLRRRVHVRVRLCTSSICTCLLVYVEYMYVYVCVR